MMKFDRNNKKDELLISERGFGFDDVVEAIEQGNLIYDNTHPNSTLYPNQYVMIVRIDDYPCFVPYVLQEDGTYFLKTVYKARKYK